MSTMVSGSTIVVSAVDSMKMAASEIVTRVTPDRKAAAPISAYLTSREGERERERERERDT